MTSVSAELGGKWLELLARLAELTPMSFWIMLLLSSVTLERTMIKAGRPKPHLRHRVGRISGRR